MMQRLQDIFAITCLGITHFNVFFIFLHNPILMELPFEPFLCQDLQLFQCSLEFSYIILCGLSYLLNPFLLGYMIDQDFMFANFFWNMMSLKRSLKMFTRRQELKLAINNSIIHDPIIIKFLLQLNYIMISTP